MTRDGGAGRGIGARDEGWAWLVMYLHVFGDGMINWSLIDFAWLQGVDITWFEVYCPVEYQSRPIAQLLSAGSRSHEVHSIDTSKP